MPAFTTRIATEEDIPAITGVMARAIGQLQAEFLTPDQVATSHRVMGLDTQLIADGTYMLVHDTAGTLAGCGGWSMRATLYGGDHSAGLRDPAILDPATDSARIRAMYTDPAFVRRGVGRLILSVCEVAAREAGFARAEMMATLAGEPLYRAAGYRVVERLGDTPVPLVRMAKSLS